MKNTKNRLKTATRPTYEEWITDHYDEMVRWFCDENDGEFKAFCATEQTIKEEFAESCGDEFEAFCREMYEDQN
ncbi:MAG: hypothetical protein ACP5N3_02055 [Candidatus Nanoarchaeia archaeon]